MARQSAWGEMVLERMDQWGQRTTWIPPQEELLPKNVFWGIFLWNLPVLFVALCVIVVVMDAVDRSSGYPLVDYSHPPDLAAYAAGAALISFVIDFLACASIRTHWNRRAREFEILGSE